MSETKFRALVVDDEKMLRDLVIRALAARDISCDEAGDGHEAEKLLAVKNYDLVITDLRMPHRNGHALAVDLLARENRPLVVVVTGVLEPRLAEDLIFRGVDALELKPLQFKVFAAKVHAMLKRRRLQSRKETEPADAAGAPVARMSNGASAPNVPVASS